MAEDYVKVSEFRTYTDKNDSRVKCVEDKVQLIEISSAKIETKLNTIIWLNSAVVVAVIGALAKILIN